MDLHTKESIDLICATLWKLNDEIILLRFKDGVHLDEQDAIDVKNGCIELFEGRKFLILVDARNLGLTLGRQGSDYFAKNKEFNDVLQAQALLVNSLALKLIARFYITISKPISEAQIFNDLEEALEWLDAKKDLLIND